MGCSDDSNFSRPMPWIGLYIAAGSLVCALAMALDAVSGLRKRKLWFPCKFFSLNATSLSLIAIATKLPVDLNTNMPRRQDQLAKLSGTVFICTAMGNFFPSIGSLTDPEVLSNVVALGIFVITVIVNMGIQMGTGVIFTFWPEHVLIMSFMLVLLVILGSSALTLQTTKQLLEEQYDQKYTLAGGDDQPKETTDKFDARKLRNDVKKYWLMAHTSSPQYVLGRSALCSASGAFCLLGAFILIEATVRAYFCFTESDTFCSEDSDYKWSTVMILISQVIAVGIGTIAPASRWFNSMSFRGNHSRAMQWCTNEFRVEKFWLQRLVDWKQSPLPYQISSRQCRKSMHTLKVTALDLCIKIQVSVVVVSKIIGLVSKLSVLLASKFAYLIRHRLMGHEKGTGSIASTSSGAGIGDFVLRLEGEEGLVHLIMKKGSEASEQWIHMGKKHQPVHLLNLLEKGTVSNGFKAVGEFDSQQVPSLGSEDPPNCWSLPVVTLMSIAMALLGADHFELKLLLKGVHQGFRYVKLVEKNLDTKGLINMREAAEIVWQGIDLHERWLDYDLQRWHSEEMNIEKTIEKLASIAKKRVSEFLDGSGSEMKTLDWPARVLAANSMYRISTTILMEHKAELHKADDLFQLVRSTIADILGACLTNMPQVIYMECICSTIEVREESVQEAAYLLGETEKILAMLGQEVCSEWDDDDGADIDKWRALRQRNPESTKILEV